MAITSNLYNHTPKKFANAEVDLGDLAFMLLNSSGTFSAAHTNISSVSSNEVTGGGVGAGGIDITGAAVTVVNTNEAKLDADDISETATGASIGPANYGALYEVATGDILVHVDFDGAKEAGEGTDFKVNWHADGIIKWTVPA